MPTCPVFAGPVTYNIIHYYFYSMLLGKLILHIVFKNFMLTEILSLLLSFAYLLVVSVIYQFLRFFQDKDL